MFETTNQIQPVLIDGLDYTNYIVLFGLGNCRAVQLKLHVGPAMGMIPRDLGIIPVFVTFRSWWTYLCRFHSTTTGGYLNALQLFIMLSKDQ